MNEIAVAISYQKTWKRVVVVLYAVCTCGFIICSASSAVLAALNFSEIAAVLAATATILIGIEKSMMLREKWKLHLAVLTRLENLLLDLHLSEKDTKSAATELKRITLDYSQELPIETRK